MKTSQGSGGKPGRNDPCPCGSGLKYKRCCGSVIRLEPAGVARPAAAPSGAVRHCGGCTACCDGWVKINVYGHEVYPGKPCPFSAGHRCSIYENRPVDPCRNFVCGWLAPGSPFPEAFRPDKLGVLIVPAKWRGGLFYALVPAGRDPDGQLITWMTRFAEKSRTPFVYQVKGDWLAYGPPEFQKEIAEKRARGETIS